MYYITLDDGLTYGPYKNEHDAKLGVLKHMGAELSELETADYCYLDYLLYNSNQPYIMYKESEYKEYLSHYYLINEQDNKEQTEQQFIDGQLARVQSPIYY